MEERTTLILNCQEIKNILFKYYFDNYHPEIKKQIFESGTMNCEIINKKNIITIEFIIKYELPIESLDKTISKVIIVTLKDLNTIINEKMSNEGYKIDSYEENICYGIGNSSDKLNFITFNLNKKAKNKTKKRGWKKHV